ncbi:MAG: V-type ATP synthase subunit F [Clostridia bacterium]|nr:V-type ATP synthase subunit F [Clostridia bacterium]
MSDRGNIAIIGDASSVLVFKTIGLDVYDETEPKAASKRIANLAASGTKVIFITEKLYEQCGETIEKYKGEAYPCLIPIPDSGGSRGIALASMKANVEKALGADILFTED